MVGWIHLAYDGFYVARSCENCDESSR